MSYSSRILASAMSLLFKDFEAMKKKGIVHLQRQNSSKLLSLLSGSWARRLAWVCCGGSSRARPGRRAGSSGWMPRGPSTTASPPTSRGSSSLKHRPSSPRFYLAASGEKIGLPRPGEKIRFFSEADFLQGLQDKIWVRKAWV